MPPYAATCLIRVALNMGVAEDALRNSFSELQQAAADASGIFIHELWHLLAAASGAPRAARVKEPTLPPTFMSNFIHLLKVSSCVLMRGAVGCARQASRASSTHTTLTLL